MTCSLFALSSHLHPPTSGSHVTDGSSALVSGFVEAFSFQGIRLADSLLPDSAATVTRVTCGTELPVRSGVVSGDGFRPPDTRSG